MYNQHKQESHGGLPDHQTPFDPPDRDEPSKALGKPGDDVIRKATKHRIRGFPNSVLTIYVFDAVLREYDILAWAAIRSFASHGRFCR